MEKLKHPDSLLGISIFGVNCESEHYLCKIQS